MYRPTCSPASFDMLFTHRWLASSPCTRHQVHVLRTSESRRPGLMPMYMNWAEGTYSATRRAVSCILGCELDGYGVSSTLKLSRIHKRQDWVAAERSHSIHSDWASSGCVQSNVTSRYRRHPTWRSILRNKLIQLRLPGQFGRSGHMWTKSNDRQMDLANRRAPASRSTVVIWEGVQ